MSDSMLFLVLKSGAAFPRYATKISGLPASSLRSLQTKVEQRNVGG
jgi:hypothetical protein